ncbi:MAG: hypothetical protein EXR27_04215 [Betaproteobacteria bacterium]|nr:hypothetical protein [Betaproteobacteria bacterium]
MNPPFDVQSLVITQGNIERPARFATADAAELDRPAFAPETYLGKEELARLAAFQFLPKKQGFLLGRLAAKRALGALLSEPDLRRIEIHNGIFGQPLVSHPSAGNIDVTVSHSHGLAVALAYSRETPMGVDLETVTSDSADTVLAALAPSLEEQAWLAAGNLDAATACGVLWTAREALGKQMKMGLNSPLAILSLRELHLIAENTWIGEYLNFPRCRCLSQTRGARVLTLATPKDVQLSAAPQMP